MTSPEVSQKKNGLRIVLWLLAVLLAINGIFWANTQFNFLDAALSKGGVKPNTPIAKDAIKLAPKNEPIAATSPAAAVNDAFSVQTPDKKKTSCLQIGPLTQQQVDTLLNVAASNGIQTPVAELAPTTASHIIQMGPYSTRAEIDKKINELKRIGVKDFAVVDVKFISLGVFSSEAAAKTQYGILGKQGVRTAKILKKSTTVNKTKLRFDALTDPQSEQLKKHVLEQDKLVQC